MLRQFPDNAFYGRLVGPFLLRELVLSNLSFDLHQFPLSFSLMIPGFVRCDSLCWFASKCTEKIRFLCFGGFASDRWKI
jgi:hypothetical protein